MALTGPAPSGAAEVERRKWPWRLFFPILVVAIIGGSVIALVAYCTLSISTKEFAPYSTPVSENSSNPSSLEVTNVNGAVTLLSWDRSNLLVNGTVTARGIGSSPDTITFYTGNTRGQIVFTAVFPPESISQLFPSYSVDIHVYIPSTASYGTVEIGTANGNINLSTSTARFDTVAVGNRNGNVNVSTINATSVSMHSVNGNLHASGVTTGKLTIGTANGNVDFACIECDSVEAVSTNGRVHGLLSTLSVTGPYQLQTTNGNIDLIFPSSRSFTLTATTVNGQISTLGVGASTSGHNLTVGTGTASIILTTTNGLITITGI